MSEKIKSMKVVRKNLIPDGGGHHDDAGKQEVLVSETEYHPELGKVVLEKQFAPDGNLEQETEYEYDQNGFLIREVLREGDGTVMEEKSFEPDEKKRIALEFRHYADGSKDKITYRYDEHGDLIAKITEDEDREVEQVAVFEYRNGLLTRQALYDEDPFSDGTAEPAEEVLFAYDDSGRVLEEETRNNTEGFYRQKVYEYNEQGHRTALKVYDESENLIERVVMEPDEEGRPVRLVEENRKKKNTLNLRYNDHGDIVYQEEYDLNGNLLNTVSRKYDEKGRLRSSEVDIQVPLRGPARRYLVEHRYSFY